MYQDITTPSDARIGHTPTLQAKYFARLGAGGNSQLFPAVQRGNFNRRPERHLGVADRHGADQVLAVALEERVLADGDEAVAISRRTAGGTGISFAGDPEPSAAVDSRRDLHLARDAFEHRSFA